MAFYIHHVPRTMWAGPPSEAQQQKALLHCDKESPVALHNKMMSSACVQGCQQDGGGVLPTRAFLHPTSFFKSCCVFSSVSPKCIQSPRVVTAEPSCHWANKALPHTLFKLTRVEEAHKTPPVLQGWTSSHYEQEETRGINQRKWLHMLATHTMKQEPEDKEERGKTLPEQ